MDVKGPAGTAPVTTRMKLSDAIPEISDDMVSAVLQRSKEARKLKKELDHRCDHGGQFSKGEVEELLKRARKGGKPDGDQAVIMAYYAQNHAEVFAPDAHGAIEKFLLQVPWAELMVDLKRFMEDLKQKEAEAKRADEIKQERLKDDIKRDDQKRQLIKDNGTKAERQQELTKREAQKAQQKKELRDASPADLDEELTGSGRLQLSDVELERLKLLKKGFANRE